MDDDRNQHLRNTESLRNLAIAQTLYESQSENFRWTRLELCKRPSQDSSQFAVSVGDSIRQLRNLGQMNRLACANYIESGIDRSAAKVAFCIFHRVKLLGLAQQTQKHGLQHVLRVRRAAGDPVGSAKHQSVMRAKRLFEFPLNRDCGFFLSQCNWQGTPPLTDLHK